MVSQSKLKTAPATTPVSVADVKAYLRIDETAEDTLLGTLIKIATEKVEQYIDKKLINQTWLTYFDSFPVKYRNARQDDWWDGTQQMAISELSAPGDTICLPFGPMVSLTALNTYGDDDVAIPSAPSNYSIDTVGPYGRISLKMGGVWPATVLRPVNGVEIEAVYGFGPTSADVPAPIKQAIILVVAKMFENRGDDTGGEFFGTSGFTFPNTAMMLLEGYRKIKL